MTMQPLRADDRQGMAVTAFVTGLLGVIFSWVPFLGLALAVLGVVFGALSRRRGLGIAGLVLGIIGVVIAIIILVAVANS